MGSVMLYDADYVIKTPDSYLRNSSIYVEGNTIRYVGPKEEIKKTQVPDVEIDCSGHILIPGLIDAHTHIDPAERGLGKDYEVVEFHKNIEYPLLSNLSDDDFYNGTLLACADSVRNGTTCVVEHLTNFARFHDNSVALGVLDSGVRGSVVRGGENQSRMDPRSNRTIEEDLKDSERFLNKWIGQNQRVQAWLGPTGIYYCCTADLLREYKKLAKDKATRFHIHLAENATEANELRKLGYSGSVGYADSLGIIDSCTSIAHACWISKAEMEIVKKTKAQIVHNPVSNMVLASGIADIPQMSDMGLNVALGSDGPAANDSLDMIGVMKTCILLHRINTLRTDALSAKTAFAMATEAGARVMGIDNLGRLEKGYLADVVGIKVRSNPCLHPMYDPIETLVYAGCGRDVTLSIVNGEILYKDGRFEKMDIAEVCDKVNQIGSNVSKHIFGKPQKYV